MQGLRSKGRSGDESGAIAIMTAVMTMALLVATALAVDVGRVAWTSRDQQGVTDRAVLDAVRVLNDRFPTGTTSLGELHTAVEQELAASLVRNPGAAEGGTSQSRELRLVELGTVDPSTGAFSSVCSAAYDPASEPTCPGDMTSVSAVRAETASFVPFIFAIGAVDSGRDVYKESIAEALSIASISVGSELASIDDGLLNDLFAQMLCPALTLGDPPTCSLGLSAAGYGALVDTTIPLGDLAGPLGITTGAPDQVLDADVSVAQLLSVAASALDDQGSPAAVALNQLALAVDAALTVNLLDILDVSAGDVGQALDAGVSLWDLVNASAQVANGTNFVSVPDLGVTVPGVTSVDSSLHVIEGPRQAIGPARWMAALNDWATVARTSQIGLGLDTTLDVDLVDVVTTTLASAGLGTLTVTADDVVVPLEADVAGGRAALKGIGCGPASDVAQTSTTTTVGTTTRAGATRIGDGVGGWADLAGVRIVVRAPLLGTILTDVTLDVRARGVAALGGVTADDDGFTGPYRAGPAETLGSGLGLSGLSNTLEVDVVQRSGGLLGGLTGATLSLLESTIESAVETTLAGALAPLEAAVVDPVLDQLGVHVANADTWVNSVDCTNRRLTQLP